MDKEKREFSTPNLTTEKIKLRFKSQFELVGYAIRLAENMIKSGRETRIKTDVQNKAMQIVAEITQGKDQFDEIPPDYKPNYAPARERGDRDRDRDHHREGESFHAKSSEKRKTRKILTDKATFP
jgi:hypothetical protein